jgi:flagellar hook-associated protein 3 FlgL
MRISTGQMHLQGINSILDRYSELATTQEQLATGLRVVNPSDDPVGMTQVFPLNEAISINEQYNRNMDAAESRLSLEESTLSNVTDVLQRVHELAVQGSNTTLSTSELKMIAIEVRADIDALKGMANTKDSNGEYLFAGDEVATEPFTEAPPGTYNYVGDSGQRNVQISGSRQIAVGDPGDDVFVNVPFSGGGTQNIFQTIADYATSLEAGTPDANITDDLKSAMETVATIRAKIGARLNSIDNQRTQNEDAILQSKQVKSTIQDLDIAEAVSRLNKQTLTLQASQQAYTRVQGLSLFNYL